MPEVFQRRLDLSAAPTLYSFLTDDSFVRILEGPFGSGKSVTCCAEVMRRACMIAPMRDNVRRFRAGVIRNTYTELRSTTIKTWLDTFPAAACGPFNYTPPFLHRIVAQRQGEIVGIDAPGLDLEVYFISLDRPEDMKKLLSFELTMAWVNEGRELSKDLFDAITGRVGRYPKKAEAGDYWNGIIVDTNPPDDDHWIAHADRVKPQGWSFYRQPSAIIEAPMAEAERMRIQVRLTNMKLNGAVMRADNGQRYLLNPQGENLLNLSSTYYHHMIASKAEDWIACYMRGERVFVREGQPVHVEFLDTTHTAKIEIEADINSVFDVGFDWGLTPAAIFTQAVIIPSGGLQWRVLAEITSERMGIKRFGEVVRSEIRRRGWEHMAMRFWGDPSGSAWGHDELSAFDHMRSVGINVLPAPTNSPAARREALKAPLTRLVNGMPGIVINPSCTTLRRGLAGRWFYPRLQVSGDARYNEVPIKNSYSHPCEALEYALAGGGEGLELVSPPAYKIMEQRRAARGLGAMEIVKVNTDWSPLA